MLVYREEHLAVRATHVPGIDNEADFESRNFNENVKWELNKSFYSKISHIWGMPDIDMFASCLNKQIECFVSWRPDPDAAAIDAFSLSWSDYKLEQVPRGSRIPPAGTIS